jgi:A/G-specific adenine glycosylase
MLQQTRVSTVIPYFLRFLAKYPTLESLARSKEQDVLRLWQGLGYYSRARHLRRCAIEIVDRLDGLIPDDIDQLLSLPGIGRYSAAAVASIAFNQRAAVLDGNVARVLCRLDAVRSDPKLPATQKKLWKRAAELVPKGNCGDFNSAMMELGAIVCTPKNPKCETCPVAKFCQARAMGLVSVIPVKRKRVPVETVHRDVLVIRERHPRRAPTRFLIEQRPARGRWASMWQFITVNPEDSIPETTSGLPLRSIRLRTELGTVRHELTHRRYVFTIRLFDALAPRAARKPRKWVTLAQLAEFPIPKPHLHIAEMLQSVRPE